MPQFEVTPIRVLIVADGIVTDGFSFEPQPSDDSAFTLNTLIAALQTDLFGLLFHVDTAQRSGTTLGGTINAMFGKRFEFTDIDLNQYDEIWMFGYEGMNGPRPTESRNPLTDAELMAIAHFMDSGGGVFACGDHSQLGSDMCSRIIRVGSMRYWDATNSPPGLSRSGRLRIDTLVPNPADTHLYGHDIGPWLLDFDDQSDNIGQTVFLKEPDHPLVQGEQGRATVFPDHMHEGLVVAPTDLTKTITYHRIDGAGHRIAEEFVEYRSTGGTRESPRVLIRGTAISHETVLEPGYTGPFVGDDGPSFSGQFDLLCAYDGFAASVGRVVTDSSFHHYIDLNLIGDPMGTTPDRRRGFQRQLSDGSWVPDAVLINLRRFFRNIASWIARPGSHFRLINSVINKDVSWRKIRLAGGVPEHSDSEIQQYGSIMYRYLAHRFGEAIVEDWVASSLHQQGLGDLTRQPFGKSMVAAALGGATLELMNAQESQQPGDHQRAEAIGMRGATLGLRSLSGRLQQTGRRIVDYAEKLSRIQTVD